MSDGKGIGGGKRRLADKVTNTLQNHSGIAIRQNIDNFYAMRKAVAAALHHPTNDPESEKGHSFFSKVDQTHGVNTTRTK